MSKNYYFLCGLPRAGNTVIASILNQNNNITVTANSILPDVLFQLELLKHSYIYNNFKDEKSYSNITKNIFDNYYSHWKSKNIIQRAPWGTPANLYLLRNTYKNRKFIILWRPVLECLASFIKIEKPKDIKQRCEQLMNQDGMIGKNLWSIQNLIKEKEKYLFIDYKDFCENTQKNIDKICKYTNCKPHKLKPIKQFKINGIKYNDDINFDKAPLHTIKEANTCIYHEYDVKNILPKSVIDKYRNIKL